MEDAVFTPRFTPTICKFNPAVDLQEVDQFGFINLAECFEKGVLPGSVDLTDESFNGVQNPGTLISRSSDVFDGLRKVEYVRSCLDRMNAEDREKAERAISKSTEVAGPVYDVTE